MGIPKFASWISKKYPGMVSKVPPATVAGVYVDMNGIIHPCCHSEDDPSVVQRTEEEKIASICYATEELITLLQPSSIIYLAMDGVAPRAKMNQQRSRRYMGASTEINAQHGMDHYTTEQAKHAEEELEKEKAALDFGLYGAPNFDDMEAEMCSPTGSTDDFGLFGADFDMDTLTALPPGYPDVNAAPSADPKIIAGLMAKRFDSNCISPGTVFMVKVANALRKFVKEKLNSTDPKDAAWKSRLIIISDTNTPGEGEHKFVDFLRCQFAARSKIMQGGAHVVVGLDADLILLCLSLHHSSIWIMRDRKRAAPPVPEKAKAVGAQKSKNDDDEDQEGLNHEMSTCSSVTGTNASVNATPIKGVKKEKGVTYDTRPGYTKGGGRKYEYYQIAAVGDGLVSEVTALLSQPHIAGINMKIADVPGGSPRIIDDFVAMATLLGNDFVPRLPSGFCGDNAMDTMLELYVRSILAHGMTLTDGEGGLNMPALYRFIEALAKVEAIRFRMVKKLQGHLTENQVAGPVRIATNDSQSPDTAWRREYYATTSISQDKLRDACESYVEGLRFVFEYYTKTSQMCAWRWYYRYHHAPLAADLALFLSTMSNASLQPLPTSATAPSPYTQLMAILPPTSGPLLPPAYRKLMQNAPQELHETFPKEWSVDYTAAGGKEHLAVAEIPFANLDLLERLEKDSLRAELDLDEDSMMMSSPVSQGTPGEFPAVVAASKKKGSVSLSCSDLERGHNKYFHDLMCAVPLAKLQELVSAEYPILFGEVDAHEKFDLGADEVPVTTTTSQGGDVSPASSEAARIYSFRDKLPAGVQYRARMYTSTLPTPGLTMTKLEAMKSRRKGNTVEKATSKRRQQMQDEGLDASAALVLQQKGFPISGLIVTVAASVAITQLVASPYISSLLFWVTDMLPIIVAFTMTGLLILQSLGVSMFRGLERPVLTRNAIRDSNVDWQCPSCIFINWAKNQWCFKCHLPFDPKTCPAVFSSRIPQSPPLYESNHATLRERVRLKDVIPPVLD